MARVEKTVFISYRRTNAPWALAIYQALTGSGYDVFFDYKGIKSGDFESVILDNIRARAHFLVLLTPSALQRCGEPNDWLRREIELALETRRNIVPLMLEGFDFDTPTINHELTGKLAELKRYNAVEVPSSYFDEAMDRLRAEHLNVSLEAVLHPASPSALRAATDAQSAAGAAPAVPENELTSTGIFERAVDATDLDAKRRYYDQAIQLNPNNAEAYNNRANLLQRRGHLNGALRDYNNAIRLKPDYAHAYSNRGSMLKQQGNLDAALSDYNECIRLKPDYAKAYYHRAIVLKALGNLGGALSDYNEAIRLKRDFAKAYNSRGILLYQGGQLDGALADCNEAIRLTPNYADAYLNRGTMLKAQRNLDGALRDYTEAIRLRPDFAKAYNDRGVTRHIQGNLAGALRDYNKAIRYEPDYANAYGNRARLWEQESDNPAALADFQTYLDLGGGLQGDNQAEVESLIRELRESL